ncbi:Hypothetical predicted protein [Olea europaea subsp. europaea]|uniref:Peptidase C14 caspase domain-containing protein n=1 Tax=Olea europaea subsp. europaea TaxID=158383 RepID=A0A8S0VAZ6_OLEEU|nr:Hypothetical predicted protein [Olea europaea subsp. europaea]
MGSICKESLERSSVAPDNDQETDTGFRGKSKHLSHDRNKIITEAKGTCHLFGRRSSRNDSPYTVSPRSSRLCLNLSGRPPGAKRAFICGVSYKKQKFRLRGVVNDVHSMRDFLVKQFNFPRDCILILSEEDSDMPPTKKNTEDGFKWLTRDLQFGDSLFFYYSGHGLRQPDFNEDEKDGFDETICPVDFKTEGMIVDNYINEAIVRPLKQGVILHAIIDSCHSGTMLDLPLVYNKTMGKWDDNRPPSGAYKGTNGGKAICFSACEDYQQAADTSALSPDKAMTGAMTYTLISAITKAISSNQTITYCGILDAMHRTNLDEDNKSLHSKISRFFRRRIIQACPSFS